jgi:hypothetical protein
MSSCTCTYVSMFPFAVISSTLEMASTVDGLPVGVNWVAPSHDHVIVATGFPPWMVHVRVTLASSIIGPVGVCVIVGGVVGWSKTLKLYYIKLEYWIIVMDKCPYHHFIAISLNK